MNIRNWPGELQRALKVAAAKTGRTVRDIIIEACEHWLKRHERKQ